MSMGDCFRLSIVICLSSLLGVVIGHFIIFPLFDLLLEFFISVLRYMGWVI